MYRRYVRVAFIFRVEESIGQISQVKEWARSEVSRTRDSAEKERKYCPVGSRWPDEFKKQEWISEC
jgi:hypothetical protein